MEENALVLLLLVSGVFILAAGTLYSQSVSSKLGKLVPELASQVLCQKDASSGEYLLALPTSPEACGQISDLTKFGEGECRHFPAEKQDACRLLAKLVEERASDCLSALLLNQSSKFAEGSPEAAEACGIISVKSF